MRANDSSSAVEWSPAQFEELQLQVSISLHPDITINFCKYCVLKRLKNSFEIVRFCFVTHFILHHLQEETLGTDENGFNSGKVKFSLTAE